MFLQFLMVGLALSLIFAGNTVSHGFFEKNSDRIVAGLVLRPNSRAYHFNVPDTFNIGS